MVRVFDEVSGATFADDVAFDDLLRHHGRM